MKLTLAIIAICFAVVSIGLSIWGFIENYKASKLQKKSIELWEKAKKKK